MTALQWYPDGVLPKLPELIGAVRHGIRSVRDDQTVPSYQMESVSLEFKRGFDWNPRTHQQDPELRHGIIRSVAAMLNTKGGTIALGVTDAGIPVGIDEELEAIRDRNPLDVLEQRLRTHLRTALQPPPLENIRVTFPRMANRIFMLIEVQPTASITYCKFRDKHGNAKEEIFVRDGNRTITLHGRERDRFVLERAQRSAFLE
jgi:predicted HTH transcriptional regulator